MPRSLRASRLFALPSLTRAYQNNLRALTEVATAAGQAGVSGADMLGAAARVGKSLMGISPRKRKAVAKKVAARPAVASPQTGLALTRGPWVSGLAAGAQGARRYKLYIPPLLQLQRGEKLPLVIMLHGCGQTGMEISEVSRMNRLAQRERFLVLYPEQERMANPYGCWNWFALRNGQAQAEAATLMAAIDKVLRRRPADPARVVVAGLSAGAAMAGLLGVLYPERFAAVAMHSGVPPGAAQSSGQAIDAMQGRRQGPLLQPDAMDEPGDADSRGDMVSASGPPWAAEVAASRKNAAQDEVKGDTQHGHAPASQGPAEAPKPAPRNLPPLLLIHGDGDSVVSVDASVRAAELWAQAVGAQAMPARVLQRGKRYPSEVRRFVRGGRTQVELQVVQGLGHAWSGGAAQHDYSDPAGPDASAWIWSFAKRQFQRQGGKK